MFTWIHEHSVPTAASLAQLWRIWSDPADWPKVDPGLSEVSIEGPFVSGARGTLRPKDGPKFRFQLINVWPERGFNVRTFLPLTSLDFIHIYEPAGPVQSARITYRIGMRGLLTPLFRRVIGNGIVRDLPENMVALARHAEAQEAA